MDKQNKFLIPIIFIGMMFFSIGFALGINSFLIPVLNTTLGVSSGESYLILAATFSTFIIFGYPASLTIAKIGYKKTMSLSFLLFAIAFALYIPSAKYESFILFLVASFFSGIGNTFLQASVNPYITILGPMESAARRMSIMGICNKLAWPVAPVFLAYVIGKDTTNTLISDLFLPFYIIIAVFVFLGILSLLAPLPEVKAEGEDSDDPQNSTYASGKTSIWQFPHLLLGALALFLYVGVETIALGTLVDYATWLNLPNAASYAWISPIAMVVGYICGILFIPKYLSQANALMICSVLGISGSILVVITPAAMSIWFVALMALGCSLMWPALWPLAMTDLGKFTKAGSSLLVMAIAGGAIIPTIYGFLKDAVGAQQSYWIALPIYLFILYYGVSGYKIRTLAKQ
ncbi:MAG: glucose/galactose MFS transporter [Bacteroidales bacterium]